MGQTELSSISTLTLPASHQFEGGQSSQQQQQHNQPLPQLQPQQETRVDSSSEEEAASSSSSSAMSDIKTQNQVEYASIVVSPQEENALPENDTPSKEVETAELPVEADYVTMNSAISAVTPEPVVTPEVSGRSISPEPLSDEDLSLGESVVLGDGILNNLRCDLTENLNHEADNQVVLALCSSRPLNLVNNSFVVDETENHHAPSSGEDTTINIEMDTTASVI